MQPFVIKQAEFVTSVGAGSAYPPPERAEIAIVGKSNVGKSSLINHLCGNKKLAKTSQTPGKTRLINFFLLNRDFYLVDLPGYGFARASKTEQAGWGSLMEQYLSSGRVQHLFLLIDIRHAPTAEDRQMFEWVLYYGLPFTLIATKADKIAKSKRRQAANQAAKLLGAPPAAIPYSSESGDGKEAVLERIGQILQDCENKA
ncbi:MAG: ribosome biogenesis GTP-binding protein YihA/YsxC [Clostridium sp.]|nr:ribosome biogenesis GTP-binding protein YihA/YsxC [Clostridium sp.]MDD7139191.1 ribosome biogenesis GTP-binding protein YihA/YsxC [Clostridium sp.]MDY6081691.1 ribosome biogenesis GTP-binding protein YihA/YsxC [Eubacteriales bacterium]